MLSLLFRTVGAWGAGLGRLLTAAEVDGNFYAIKQAIEDLQDNPAPGNGVSRIVQVTGSANFTIYQDNGTSTTITLPTATPLITTLNIDDDVYTLRLEDRGKYLRCRNDDTVGGCRVTIPADAELAIPVDTEYYFVQASPEEVAFDWATDIAVNFKSGKRAATAGEWSAVMLKKVGADEWDLLGELDDA